MQSWFRGKEPGGATEEKNETERKKERQWPSSRSTQFLVLLDRSLRRSRTVERRNSSFRSAGTIFKDEGRGGKKVIRRTQFRNDDMGKETKYNTYQETP
jgi:hypothetical protein